MQDAIPLSQTEGQEPIRRASSLVGGEAGAAFFPLYFSLQLDMDRTNRVGQTNVQTCRKMYICLTHVAHSANEARCNANIVCNSPLDSAIFAHCGHTKQAICSVVTRRPICEWLSWSFSPSESCHLANLSSQVRTIRPRLIKCALSRPQPERVSPTVICDRGDWDDGLGTNSCNVRGYRTGKLLSELNLKKTKCAL